MNGGVHDEKITYTWRISNFYDFLKGSIIALLGLQHVLKCLVPCPAGGDENETGGFVGKIW